MSAVYDPQAWLTSLTQSLREYVIEGLPDVYDVQFEFPDTNAMRKGTPFEKTIIHFEQDTEETPVFGMGDNIVQQDYDDVEKTLVEHEASNHSVHFDVGIWASKQSGGSDARLEARQDLGKLLQGPANRARIMEATQGIEIVSFTGGRNLLDSINDLPVWRMADMSLTVRVFALEAQGPIDYIESAEIDLALYVDGQEIT